MYNRRFLPRYYRDFTPLHTDIRGTGDVDCGRNMFADRLKVPTNCQRYEVCELNIRVDASNMFQIVGQVIVIMMVYCCKMSEMSMYARFFVSKIL